MGVVSVVQNRNDSIMNTIDQSYEKTIEDEEPLKQIKQLSIQINEEKQTKRLIQQQNYLFPQDTLANQWKQNVRIQSSSDIDAFTELKITSKGILKSPNSQPQSIKSDKKVSFNKDQIKKERFFRSHRTKKHKVTLKDLEQLF